MIEIENSEFVKENFRLLIKSSAIMFGLGNFLYSGIFYYIGFEYWYLPLCWSLLSIIFIWMSDIQRSFPVFLTCILSIFALSTAWATYLTLTFGREFGFHFPLIPMLALTVVSGRIGGLSKSLIVVGLASLIIYLDTVSVSSTSQAGLLSKGVVNLIHLINGFVAAFALTSLVFHHFQLMTRQQNNLRALAMTDSLTQLFNRSHMQATAVKLMNQCQRHQRPFAVLMCDLDYFKDINDSLGHDAGDAVLRQISIILKKLARISDSVGRWGGEEFLFLLPETDVEGAKNLASRIRKEVEETSISFKDHKIKVTITIGIGFMNNQDNLESVLARADKALYIAKSKGRNRVRMEVNRTQ